MIFIPFTTFNNIPLGNDGLIQQSFYQNGHQKERRKNYQILKILKPKCVSGNFVHLWFITSSDTLISFLIVATFLNYYIEQKMIYQEKGLLFSLLIVQEFIPRHTQLQIIIISVYFTNWCSKKENYLQLHDINICQAKFSWPASPLDCLNIALVLATVFNATVRVFHNINAFI